MQLPNFYAAGIERAGHRRKDEAWLKERLVHQESRFLPVWRSQNLVRQGTPRAVFVAPSALSAIEEEAILLGFHEERAFFAIDVSRHEAPLATLSLADEVEFTDLRRVGPLLERFEGSLLAYARGITYWHQRHRFCGLCGGPTRSRDAGHVRVCLNETCKTPHFPRTDPAVIMLVHDGDRCLLGRQAVWPTGMHSTLAGFVEPGESLEEAVAREVREETAIEVTDVAYHSSQPWPFPSSVMLGFHARAVTTEIHVDRSELEDARWFERNWILNHEDDDTLRLPRRDSIARRLVEDWLRR